MGDKGTTGNAPAGEILADVIANEDAGKIEALTAERDGLKEQLIEIGADRDRASDAVAGVQRERDELAAELAKLGAVLIPLDQAKYPWPDDAVTDVDKILLVISGAFEVREKFSKLQGDYDEIAKQRDGLTAKLAAATKVANVTKAAKPPKPRAAGPLSAKVERLDPVDLFQLLQDGSFTIVFSDGKSEIALAPLAVTGNAWARMPAGVMLRDPQTIKADVAVNLAGFALFDSDGTQLGWSELMRPQRIHAGQEVKLDRQIVF